jgi:anaerobic ribonucleoside-triphosphate reductase activating protein
MYISGIVYESLVDGIGVRATIFISGCLHQCKGCQNPKTHNFKNGKEFTPELQKEIINKIKDDPLIQGITLSGGDPVYSARDLIEFIVSAKLMLNDINIWLYTGFKFEELVNSTDIYKKLLVSMCDVIVDGEFIEEQKDITLSFKGSKNQRIIDVKKSLEQNDIIELI